MFKSSRSDARHALYVLKTYNITGDEYNNMLDGQDGRCFICLRLPGSKRLAVDHDHKCCNGPYSCGRCVRGLLCKKCNRDVLGNLKDDPAALRRAAFYLENPPARAILMLV